jgi:hypothetical protein
MSLMYFAAASPFATDFSSLIRRSLKLQNKIKQFDYKFK